MAQTPAARPWLLDSCMVGLVFFVLRGVQILLRRFPHHVDVVSSSFRPADLGRHRQEELPLGGRERNGPSFAPGRRNGTSHYSKELKKNLKAGWNVAFHDIESEQMKGLHIEGSRPWANKAHFPKPPQAGVLALPDKNSSSRVEKPMDILPEKAPIRSQSPPASESPSQQLIPSESESILRAGSCSIFTRSGIEIPDTHYVMKVNYLTDRAYLALRSRGKSLKMLDVVNLDAPLLENQYCIVSSSRCLGDERYSVKLENFPATSRFKFELESLRRAALPESSSEDVTVAQPSLTTSRRPSSDGNTNRILDLDEKGSSGAENTPSSSKTSRQLPLVGNTNRTLDLIEQPLSTAIQDLVDLETTVGDHRETENLGDFCRRVTLELTGSHMDMSENAFKDIQTIAIESWLKRGFIDDGLDSLKTELLGLVQLLDRIERRARMRPISTPTMNSDAVMNSGKKCSPRIKYSLDEIKSLRPHAQRSSRLLFSAHEEMTSSEAIVEAPEAQMPLARELACHGTPSGPESGLSQLDGPTRPSSANALDVSQLEDPSTAQEPSKLDVSSSWEPLQRGGLKTSLWCI